MKKHRSSLCYPFFAMSQVILSRPFKGIHNILEPFQNGFKGIGRSSSPDVFLGKVFWKYTANFQENTHAEVWFQ